MHNPKDENLEELIQAYTSPSQIKQAMREKAMSEKEKEEKTGEKIKHYPKPQRQLNLHDHTGKEAEREIERFIENSQRQRIRTVRIITGKGLHSKDGESILKPLAETLLAKLRKQNVVLSYKWEQGKGSLVVYLT